MNQSWSTGRVPRLSPMLRAAYRERNNWTPAHASPATMPLGTGHGWCAVENMTVTGTPAPTRSVISDAGRYQRDLRPIQSEERARERALRDLSDSVA
ncbi:hypothetical protein [Streptomyces zhihengii]